MKNLTLRNPVIFTIVLTCTYLLMDLAADEFLEGQPAFAWAHAFIGVSALLVASVLVSQAARSRARSEAVLQKAREELEVLVGERTADLAHTNQLLQAEIAERTTIEEALRDSEAKYRLLFENMAQGFALCDPLYDDQGRLSDLKVLEVNHAFQRHTGANGAAVVGRRMSEIFPEITSLYLPRVEQVTATRTPTSFEYYASTIGRHQRVWMFPAGAKRLATTIEDISERTFAQVFHFSPDALGIVEAATGVVLDVNEAFSLLLGHAREDVIGSRWDELGLFAAADAAGLAKLFKGEGQVLDLEVNLFTCSGAAAATLLSLAPVMVGDQACVLMIAHDITARKQSEEALRQAQAELAAGIQARAALEERSRLARELHDSVSQALYGIALGINTALTMFDADRDKTLEALQYALPLTGAALTEMRALIFALRPESLETEGLVAALTKQAEALGARFEIEVELGLCEEPELPLQAKEALYRIAQEAVHNAVRHAQPSRLSLRLSCTQEQLRLEIVDNGVGFDPRADHSGHLGLKSMRERAQGLGGTIEIISAPECGTQVVVSAPLARGDE